jgi:hypothetical protein
MAGGALDGFITEMLVVMLNYNMVATLIIYKTQDSKET